ncbi:hypothetical protein BDV95DRAFT_630464 [Massariosphaeria phaeospora]|uniref:DUF7732 domain-containing protein n=1 Tax=Massariosphaeria phaeospora TaxID=100035 RepID=A0A7C8MJQ3_9PLEO|nr:hypothetical protein BDV95DRAFT_630464 [Massariosphaeria phaeospora]
MRVSQLYACLVAIHAVHAVSLPNTNALDLLEEHAGSAPRSDVFSPEHPLEKRKGGGGGGGKGGGGGGSSGGGGRSSSGTSSSGRTNPSSNVGGATRSGSGPARSFGGGGFYGGGASTPYASGQNSPRRGLPARALLAPALMLAIFPGIWLWSVYPYYLNNQYRFVNETVRNATNPNGLNTTLPVICLCQQFAVCGCDENDNDQYFKDLVGNGDYNKLNKSLVTVSDVEGKRSLVINGTLPNGTTAPGGTDDAGASLALSKYTGCWMMGILALYAVVLL